MVEDEDPRLGVQPLGQHDLLLVAAGKVEAERVDAGRPDLEPLDPARREPPLFARSRSSRSGCRLAEVGRA